VSRGISPIPENKQRIEGVISIDDPNLYQHLRPDGPLLPLLTNRKKLAKIVIYGRTIHAYALM